MATHTHLPSPSFCCALENVYRTTQLSKQMSKALCSQESLQITLDFAKIETATRIHFTLPEKKIAPRMKKERANALEGLKVVKKIQTSS